MLCAAFFLFLFRSTAAAQPYPVDVLHYVDRNTEGGTPIAMIQASDGNFYGVTDDSRDGKNASLFRVTPQGAFSVVHWFTGGLDGDNPTGLIQARDGYLYGMTRTGGQYGFGTIFRTTLYGECSVVYAFSARPTPRTRRDRCFHKPNSCFLLSPV